MPLIIRGVEAGRIINLLETAMKWETPSAIDLRFGFEITMYIANR